ncbi:MAG: glycosyltransferase family 1 protein [Bacteroidetes bacterium]|nr:glycosyltransferase family 1 protein [Bacteroidota bacterium]MBS1974637.1 glycosyltransferase family 1 protein [Bacteroidota bacterium]
MRLMIVGSGSDYAIENFYVTHIENSGIEVYYFKAAKFFYEFYDRSISNKLVFRLGLSPIYKKINNLFKTAVEDFEPDVVWVFKGMEIFPETLQWAKNKKILLINYNPDNPFIFTGKGSGNKNITDSIGIYDFHFTYSYAIKNKIETSYNKPVSFLPFGFELPGPVFDLCCQQDELLKVCFLGNPDRQRAAFLHQLASRKIALDVYGHGWKRFVADQNIAIYPPVTYGDGFWKTLRKYRVQLNLMRIHNLDSHNMRSFEVPAVGGVMLAPDTLEHRLFFEEEKEIFLFSNVDACAEQVRNIIALEKNVADELRKKARARSITSGYSYKERASYALNEIKLFQEGISRNKTYA